MIYERRFANRSAGRIFFTKTPSRHRKWTPKRNEPPRGRLGDMCDAPDKPARQDQRE
jgi:hypothetical protein